MLRMVFHRKRECAILTMTMYRIPSSSLYAIDTIERMRITNRNNQSCGGMVTVVAAGGGAENSAVDLKKGVQ